MEGLTLEPAGTARSTRRRARWGVLGVVAVAAGALVVTSGGDDGAERPGLPVALESSVGAREAAVAADSMRAWVTYLPGDDLPALGGEAPAYRLPATVTEAQVRALADALDIDGDVVADELGWSVYGAADSVHVTEGGGGQWWFSPTTVARPGAAGSSGSGSAGCVGGADCLTTTIVDCGASDGPAECITGECPQAAECAVVHGGPATPCDAGGVCADDARDPAIALCGPGVDCVEPVRPIDGDCVVSSDGSITCPDDTGAPVDLPSEEEARAIALDLLTAAGVNVDDAAVTVEGPYDAWYVSVEPRLDGVPSGLVASVSVGSGGEIISASGYLVVPERLGGYPVLDTRATIDRANTQSAVDGGPVTMAPGDVGVQRFDSTGTEIGSVDDIDATTTPACTDQPGGSEICEQPVDDDPGCVNGAAGDATVRDLICELPTCPEAVPPADEAVEAPGTIDCVPPALDPGFEVGSIEVVLVEAERALVPLGAVDGSTDVYLVPAYRFADADGGRVDLAAVADSELTTPPTTGTSPPDPVDPPLPEPQPCEPLVEEDASGTTHTVPPAPDCLVPEPRILEEGQEPEIGVGYYVDVDTECGSGSFELGGRVWATWKGDTGAWTDDRHEGGTFTLDAPDHGTFVGDAGARTKVAEFRTLGPAEDLFCLPQSRP